MANSNEVLSKELRPLSKREMKKRKKQIRKDLWFNRGGKVRMSGNISHVTALALFASCGVLSLVAGLYIGFQFHWFAGVFLFLGLIAMSSWLVSAHSPLMKIPNDMRTNNRFLMFLMRMLDKNNVGVRNGPVEEVERSLIKLGADHIGAKDISYEWIDYRRGRQVYDRVEPLSSSMTVKEEIALAKQYRRINKEPDPLEML